jgi:hypothetical protein
VRILVPARASGPFVPGRCAHHCILRVPPALPRSCLRPDKQQPPPPASAPGFARPRYERCRCRFASPFPRSPCDCCRRSRSCFNTTATATSRITRYVHPSLKLSAEFSPSPRGKLRTFFLIRPYPRQELRLIKIVQFNLTIIMIHKTFTYILLKFNNYLVNKFTYTDTFIFY